MTSHSFRTARVRAAGATLATRDTDDFDGLGIPLVNPFAVT